jgi:hypothetical protein
MTGPTPRDPVRDRPGLIDWSLDTGRRNETMRRIATVLTCSLAIAAPVVAQTSAPPTPSPEMRFYDFWPGRWAKIVDGRPDPKASTFTVERGVHPASWEETWRLVDAAGVVSNSRAIRAWDQVGKRWMFVWVSDNALFQVWEGRKVGERWYIEREFEVDGKRFRSRQAWWPEGEDRVARVSERSFDGGATWQLRFREEYGRVR